MKSVYFVGVCLAFEIAEIHDSVLKSIQTNPQTKELAAVLAKPEYKDLASQLSSQDESRMYTVMAPSNEAMAQLASIGKMTDVPVKDVLRYHIMPGVVSGKMIDSLHFGSSSYSTKGRVQGLKLARTMEGKIQVSSGPLPPATVLSADIQAANGVVHVIDRLLVPPYSVEDTLRMANLTNFLALATHNDLIVSMDKSSGGTVFAPTNDALETLLRAHPDILKDDDAIYELVRWHFAPSQIRFSTRISSASPASLTTLAGPVQILRKGEDLEVNHVPVKRADLITRFGVLYILEGTLNHAPNSFENVKARKAAKTREAIPI